MKIVKTILKTVIFGLLLFVVAILITSRTDVLGIRSMVVLTGSMEPSIPVASIIFVGKEDFYQIGEVIAFKNSQGVTITHRIADKLEENGTLVFKTKGDANNAGDSELIPAGNIVGKQILTIPYLGRITAFLKTPLGFISLVIMPAIVFIIGELITIKKELEKQISDRRDVIRRIREGSAEYPLESLGITVLQFTVNELKVEGQVADAAEKEEKERRERAADKLEIDNVSDRIASLRKRHRGMTVEEATRIVQTERGKVKKTVVEVLGASTPVGQDVLGALGFQKAPDPKDK